MLSTSWPFGRRNTCFQPIQTKPSAKKATLTLFLDDGPRPAFLSFVATFFGMQKSDLWLAVVYCLGVAKIANGFVAPSIFFPARARQETLSGALCQFKDTSSENAVPVAAGDADVPDSWDCKTGTTKIVTYGMKGNWMAILILFQKEGKNFDNINFATAISQLAKIRSLEKQDTLFLQFLEAMEANLQDPDEDPKCYANVAHGLAKLNLRDNDITGRVFYRLADANVAKRFVDKGNAQHIANTAWACATLGHSCPELFAAIGTTIVPSGSSTMEMHQNIANTALACAKLGHSCPELFAAIGTTKRSKWLVDYGDAQNIANTAWACAKLGHSCPELFTAIARIPHSKWLGDDVKPQAIANTAWACATLGHSCPELFTEIGTTNRSKWLVDNGKPQAISMTAWACATLGHSCPELFAAIGTTNRSGWLVDNGKPQAISKTAWACATLGHSCPELFAAIGTTTRSKWLVDNGNAKEIADMVWACETLGHSHRHCFGRFGMAGNCFPVV
jgi:hypothetical protein